MPPSVSLGLCSTQHWLHCVSNAAEGLILRTAILAILAMLGASPSFAADTYWVTADFLNRRTCPSTHCGIVGQLFYREEVTAYEERDGWVRISKPSDTSCREGQSDYLDAGGTSCSDSNGKEYSKSAEWVASKYLTATRPAHPGDGEEGVAKVVSNSDDFMKYKSTFVKATNELVTSGRCTLDDFRQMSGWLKTFTTYHERPVYFTYCGGLNLPNRIYLNAATGQIWQ